MDAGARCCISGGEEFVAELDSRIPEGMCVCIHDMGNEGRSEWVGERGEREREREGKYHQKRYSNPSYPIDAIAKNARLKKETHRLNHSTILMYVVHTGYCDISIHAAK